MTTVREALLVVIGLAAVAFEAKKTSIHELRLRAPEEVDAEVRALLSQAYDLA